MERHPRVRRVVLVERRQLGDRLRERTQLLDDARPRGERRAVGLIGQRYRDRGADVPGERLDGVELDRSQVVEAVEEDRRRAPALGRLAQSVEGSPGEPLGVVAVVGWRAHRRSAGRSRRAPGRRSGAPSPHRPSASGQSRTTRDRRAPARARRSAVPPSGQSRRRQPSRPASRGAARRSRRAAHDRVAATSAAAAGGGSAARSPRSARRRSAPARASPREPPAPARSGRRRRPSAPPAGRHDCAASA